MISLANMMNTGLSLSQLTGKSRMCCSVFSITPNRGLSFGLFLYQLGGWSDFQASYSSGAWVSTGRLTAEPLSKSHGANIVGTTTNVR